MSTLELNPTPFPWREGNRFRLLIDGDQFFPPMLDAIAAAQSYILLEMYLMESGAVTTRFIAALRAAADREVTVTILLDDFGSIRLHRADRERLQHANIRVRYYNRLRYRKLQRNFARNHRKLLLVDGRIAFVGGAGITDEFDPPVHPERRWRETMVAIEGPVVADWHALFRGTWNHMADGDLPPYPNTDAPEVGDLRGRVNFSRGILHAEIKRTAISRIRHAQYRVWLATAYFVPSMKFRRGERDFGT